LPYLDGAADLAERLDADLEARLLAALPGLKERAKTLVELVDSARFLWVERPLPLDDKAAVLLDGPGRELLRAVGSQLATAPEWSAAETENLVRAFAEERGLKLGKVAQPLRAALTGRATSPPIFDVLAVLGRDESLGRIADQAG